MHPAYSVIFFTVASGAGYGLLFWLGLMLLTGGLAGASWVAVAGLALALSLITGGLLASTRHLGHPERARLALSQWRSSWLSREGIAALATYVPAGLLGLLCLFGIETGWTAPLAALAAIGAALTVYCTGQIYASLRTVPHWNMALVPAIYLALAAASGGLLLVFLLAAFGEASAGLTLVTLVSLAGAGALKWRYFARIDETPARYTQAMALGLPHGAEIHPLDPPHTMPNFVMREMGYQVARRHVVRLRALTMALLVALPLVLSVLALFGAAPLFLALAILSAGLGLLTERWLFFAEARHLSMLYYNRDAA